MPLPIGKAAKAETLPPEADWLRKLQPTDPSFLALHDRDVETFSKDSTLIQNAPLLFAFKRSTGYLISETDVATIGVMVAFDGRAQRNRRALGRGEPRFTECWLRCSGQQQAAETLDVFTLLTSDLRRRRCWCKAFFVSPRCPFIETSRRGAAAKRVPASRQRKSVRATTARRSHRASIAPGLRLLCWPARR